MSWRVSLILKPKYSLLNREWIRVYVARALAAVLSIGSFHVIPQSKMTPKYFTIFTNGIFLAFSFSTPTRTLNLLENGSSGFSCHWSLYSSAYNTNSLQQDWVVICRGQEILASLSRIHRYHLRTDIDEFQVPRGIVYTKSLQHWDNVGAEKHPLPIFLWV